MAKGKVGIRYPFKIGASGDVELSAGTAHRRDMLIQILVTTPGERRANPEFGSRIMELVFENNDELLETLGRIYVIEAIERWLPSIEIQDVSITTDPEVAEDGEVVFTIQYRDTETGSTDLFSFGVFQ